MRNLFGFAVYTLLITLLITACASTTPQSLMPNLKEDGNTVFYTQSVWTNGKCADKVHPDCLAAVMWVKTIDRWTIGFC